MLLLPCSSTVEVAAPSSAVGVGPELSLKLGQAPDPGAVGAEVGLDLGGQFAEGGEVDAEQLRALLQRGRNVARWRQELTRAAAQAHERAMASEPD